MAHRHEWVWIGTKPGQGEFCRTCGSIRDRDKALPPPVIVQEGARAFWKVGIG